MLKKKWISSALVMLLLAVTACGTPDATTGGESTATSTAKLSPIETQGLAYEVNPDGTTCSITGIGTCSEDIIVVPAQIGMYKVTRIDHRAFSNSGIVSVKMPDKIDYIGYDAFKDCTSLTSIEITDSVKHTGDYAFAGCSTLKELKIPEGVTVVANYLVSGCISLESVELPESVVVIGASAFSGCSTIRNISLPSGVATIGNYAFSYCSSLAEVIIPSGIGKIEQCTFLDCKKLASVTLPEKLVSVGRHAFAECSALISIYFETPEGWNVPSDTMGDPSRAAEFFKTDELGVARK